jgi:hypothetical protein
MSVSSPAQLQQVGHVHSLHGPNSDICCCVPFQFSMQHGATCSARELMAAAEQARACMLQHEGSFARRSERLRGDKCGVHAAVLPHACKSSCAQHPVAR